MFARSLRRHAVRIDVINPFGSRIANKLEALANFGVKRLKIFFDDEIVQLSSHRLRHQFFVGRRDDPMKPARKFSRWIFIADDRIGVDIFRQAIEVGRVTMPFRFYEWDFQIFDDRSIKTIDITIDVEHQKGFGKVLEPRRFRGNAFARMRNRNDERFLGLFRCKTRHFICYLSIMSDSSNTGTNKIYTRTGDKGKTSLIGGTRVSKSNLRLAAYGTIDELNSFLGLLVSELGRELKSHPERQTLEIELKELQSDLFNVGSRLACEDEKVRTSMPGVSEDHITQFEKRMDEYSLKLAPLKNFILPGGTPAASVAHIARTVCRRAERECVRLEEAGETVEPEVIKYVNRLSDYLFVLARYICVLAGAHEVLWAPRKK
jgi:cob(I)alamin adenosyltransferase